MCVCAIVGGIFLISKRKAGDSEPESPADTTGVEFENTEEELETVELTDELYEEKWQGKKQLIWLNDLTSNFDTNIIVELNDILVERGYDFVIRYKEADAYSDEFVSDMKAMKDSGDAMDLFNIGGVYEGDSTNRYEECVSEGLLSPLDEYLQSEEGATLKEAFPDKVWETLRVNGSIYSYDWRTLPCVNLNGYVNQEYAEKYHITEETTLSQLKDIIETIPEKDTLQIIWADSNLADAWENEELMDFISTSQIPVKQYYEINWETIPEFLMIIQSENFVSASDTQILLEGQESNIVKMKLVDGKVSTVTNNLLGVASWSENQKEAFTFINLVNTDKEIANLLQYGIEGRNYKVEDDVVTLVSQKTGLGEWTISNKRISLRQGLEPEGKEAFYENYLNALTK